MLITDLFAIHTQTDICMVLPNDQVKQKVVMPSAFMKLKVADMVIPSEIPFTYIVLIHMYFRL